MGESARKRRLYPEITAVPIFDKTKWHTEGKFPADLAPEQGSVHIGFFAVAYVDDYVRAFPDAESAYHVADTPESFARARAFLDRAYS